MSEERPEDSGTEEGGESPRDAEAPDIDEPAEVDSNEASGSREAGESGDREEAECRDESADEDSEALSPAGDSESLEELARALENARRDAQEHKDMALRARAELENVRRRAERDVANAHRYGLDRFVNEFLPVRDSLELGISAAGDDVGVEQVREGMELTLKLMTTAFDKLGVEVIDPSGEPFDPELHQAMSMQEGEEGQSGSVLNVVQKGYRLNERLVRPALVVVAK